MASLLDGITGGIGGAFGTIGNVLSIILPVLLIGGVLLFLTWFFLDQKKYNKRIIILRATNNNNFQYFFDKAKAFKDKNGVDAWRLKALKKRCEVPPNESIVTTIKGGLMAFCVYDSNQQITWISPKADYEGIEKGITGKLNFEPISTQSKANYAYEMQYNKRLRSNGWKENMPAIIGGVTLIILVMVTLLFTPKLYEGFEKVSLAQADASNKISQSIDKLDEIITSQQQIIGSYEEEKIKGMVNSES